MGRLRQRAIYDFHNKSVLGLGLDSLGFPCSESITPSVTETFLLCYYVVLIIVILHVLLITLDQIKREGKLSKK